jgi:hypothetical protein
LELIKYGGRKLWNRIHQLIKIIWEKEQMPQEWSTAITCPIYKQDRTGQEGDVLQQEDQDKSVLLAVMRVMALSGQQVKCWQLLTAITLQYFNSDYY